MVAIRQCEFRAEFELAADEVVIYREDHRLVIEPVERRPSLAEVLAGWGPLDEEIPESRRSADDAGRHFLVWRRFVTYWTRTLYRSW